MATQQYTPDATTIVEFTTIPQRNETKTKKEGRPIFDDLEVIYISQAADRQSRKVFPAHEVIEVDPEGEQITYATRYADQYKQFKNGNQQTVAGTPLSEVPFLTQAKRSELRALGVLTVESLAALDGQNLKNLGQGGRELKEQAKAYIDTAQGTANAVQMASERDYYRAEMERLQAVLQDQGVKPEKGPAPAEIKADAVENQMEGTPQELDNLSEEELKDYIKDRAGQKPRGNPGRDALLSMARDLKATE